MLEADRDRYVKALSLGLLDHLLELPFEEMQEILIRQGEPLLATVLEFPDARESIIETAKHLLDTQ